MSGGFDQWQVRIKDQSLEIYCFPAALTMILTWKGLNFTNQDSLNFENILQDILEYT